MFTAVILMCSLETMKEPGACVTLMNNQFFMTHTECELDVFDAVRTGRLTDIYPDLKPVDFYCVNWLDLKA